MINIRKNRVNSVEEIYSGLLYEYLCNKKKVELPACFVKIKDDIANDELVTDFWNLLIDYKKHDKLFGTSVENNYSADGIPMYDLAYLTTLLGGVTLYKATNFSGFLGASCVAFVGMSGMALLNQFYHLPKAEKIQNLLEAMRIIEPRLYDIELCFNKVDPEKILNNKFIGKKAYQKAHNLWLKELDEKGVDLTKSYPIEYNKLGEKIKEVYDTEFMKDEETL